MPKFSYQKEMPKSKNLISNPEKILWSSLSLEMWSIAFLIINHELSIPGKKNEDEMMKNFKIKCEAQIEGIMQRR